MANAQDREKAIHEKVLVDGGIKDVWNAWTTKEGIQSFFAPGCNVDLRVDGPYEIFFAPTAPVGQRGADGMRIMAIQPEKMLAFDWNAPPSLPEIRLQRTHVIVRFKAIGEKQTEVSLTHDGWGEGGQWDAAFDYFTKAWKNVVLPRLQYRFSVGPVDWNNPPELTPK